MTNDNQAMTQAEPVAGLREDDIMELIAIAQCLQDQPNAECQARSRILAEITKRLNDASKVAAHPPQPDHIVDANKMVEPVAVSDATASEVADLMARGCARPEDIEPTRKLAIRHLRSLATEVASLKARISEFANNIGEATSGFESQKDVDAINGYIGELFELCGSAALASAQPIANNETAARELAATVLESMCDEEPLNGNFHATACALLAAGRIRRGEQPWVMFDREEFTSKVAQLIDANRAAPVESDSREAK